MCHDIDGKVEPACITPVKDEMSISLELPAGYIPLRRISGFMPHPVGGIGKPWWVKKSSQRFIEVVCFAHGCNLRCPQCQNYTVNSMYIRRFDFGEFNIYVHINN